MKTFRVTLTRRYFVFIETENEQKAKELSEFFVGDCPDHSIEKNQLDYNFRIKEIEMFFNNSDEAVVVND